MDALHENAVPILIKDSKQIGWHYENQDFSYQAFEHDDQVKVYIVWGDDQPADETWFSDWEGASRYLKILLREE